MHCRSEATAPAPACASATAVFGVTATTISGPNGARTINRYDEYGIPRPGNVGRFQYTGQAWLPEIGMYYYRARMYSPTLGRFLQTDPIGYGDGMNSYAYVGNDPVNARDPSGATCQQVTGSNICTHGQNGGYGGTFPVGLCLGCSGTSTISITGSAGGAGGTSGSIDTYKVGNFDSATKAPVGNPWIEVRGTGGLAGFFLTSAAGGQSRCPHSPTFCAIWADPDVRPEMIRAWYLSRADGPPGSKNEYGFWIGQRGNDYFPYEMHRGNGWEFPGIMSFRPHGAFIWFHTHPFTRAEGFYAHLQGSDMMLIQRNHIMMIAMSHGGIFEFDFRN